MMTARPLRTQPPQKLDSDQAMRTMGNEAATTGPAPTPVGYQILRDEPTLHRITSVMRNLPTSGPDLDGPLWEAGFKARFGAAGCITPEVWKWLCDGATDEDGNELPKPPKSDRSWAPFRWMDVHTGVQRLRLCAQIRGRINAQQEAELAAEAGLVLDANIDQAFEVELWHGNPDSIIETPNVYKNGDPVSSASAAAWLQTVLQCSPVRLHLAMSGGLAWHFRKIGFIHEVQTPDGPQLQTCIGGHYVSTGCYPTNIGPGGAELDPADVAAGMQWVGITGAPAGVVGEGWDLDHDVPNTGINQHDYDAERSIGIVHDGCHTAMILVKLVDTMDVGV